MMQYLTHTQPDFPFSFFLCAGLCQAKIQNTPQRLQLSHKGLCMALRLTDHSWEHLPHMCRSVVLQGACTCST